MTVTATEPSTVRSSRPRNRVGKLDRLAEFRRVEQGIRVYACNGCRRDMQPDNRKGGVPKLPNVVRHYGGGHCGTCSDSIRKYGKPRSAGELRGAGVAPAADEVPDRSGLCECGCGRRTTIATRTRRALGQYRGQPLRYLPGHSAATRHARDEDEPAPEPEVEPEHEWKARAACRTGRADPRAFELPDRWRGGGPTPQAEKAARRYCARCPVLDECHGLAEQLNDAAAWPVTGLWGGEWRSHTGVEPIRTGPIPVGPVETAPPVPADSAA